MGDAARAGRQVVVAAFTTPFEAQIACGALEREGIAAALQDLALVGVAWHLSNAVGGVKLLVAEGDARRAEAVLQRARTRLRVVEPDPANEPHVEEDEAVDVAPADDLALRAFRAAVFGLVMAPPLFQLWSAWLLLRCARAGGPASKAARGRAGVALVIDALVLGAVAMGLWLRLR